jgi:hypothetical protein
MFPGGAPPVIVARGCAGRKHFTVSPVLSTTLRPAGTNMVRPWFVNNCNYENDTNKIQILDTIDRRIAAMT